MSEEIATIKGVQKLLKPTPSDATASRKICLCRDALGKAKHQYVTMKEFCLYWGLPLSDCNS